jgi:ubiquinone biosynthesis protein UbiJ
MDKQTIALARLAERETSTISASCEMFTQYYDRIPDGSELAKIEKKIAKIQDQADALNRRLERLLKPYTAIEVDEIY